MTSLDSFFDTFIFFYTSFFRFFVAERESEREERKQAKREERKKTKRRQIKRKQTTKWQM